MLPPVDLGHHDLNILTMRRQVTRQRIEQATSLSVKRPTLIPSTDTQLLQESAKEERSEIDIQQSTSEEEMSWSILTTLSLPGCRLFVRLDGRPLGRSECDRRREREPG
jgi:hypothetical protein